MLCTKWRSCQSTVLVTISKFVSICNRSRARLLYNSRNRAFWRGYPHLNCPGLLEHEGSSLTLKIYVKCWKFYTPIVLVYLHCFRRSSLLKCVSQPKFAKNFAKPPIFGVQGRSRSSMLVPLQRTSAVLVIISRKSVSICNRSHARRANSGDITTS